MRRRANGRSWTLFFPDENNKRRRRGTFTSEALLRFLAEANFQIWEVDWHALGWRPNAGGEFRAPHPLENWECRLSLCEGGGFTLSNRRLYPPGNSTVTVTRGLRDAVDIYEALDRLGAAFGYPLTEGDVALIAVDIAALDINLARAFIDAPPLVARRRARRDRAAAAALARKAKERWQRLEPFEAEIEARLATVSNEPVRVLGVPRRAIVRQQLEAHVLAHGKLPDET